VVNWIPLFRKPELVQIILDSLTFLGTKERMILHAYVIMENHLHLVGRSHDFASEMKNFKSFTARRIVDSLRQSGPGTILKQLAVSKKRHKLNQEFQVWQEGFHPEAILSESMLRDKIEYIHLNPVRRGYVENPEHWRYSSAGQYLARPGLVSIEMPI
jgi:REP element-mobilizing transposase RayT